jgi:molecular chaperone Hsp33
LGVLVDTDYTCKQAGGVLIQLLPFADEAVAEQLEINARKMPPVTTALEMAKPEDILAGYLDGIPFDIVDEFDCFYRCDCTRDRTDRALISLGKKQLQELMDDERETVSLDCHFCDAKYVYTQDDLKKLMEEL